MSDKAETYLINITILEGRHYAWPNMNSFVIVKIKNQKKLTPVKKSTDSPYYNEYYVFEIKTTLNKLLDCNINITVCQPRAFGKRKKVLGYFLLDVATVWAQPDHQFYNKWAILNAPIKDDVGGTRGYLKVNIAILGKGEIPKFPEVTTNTDKIEGNLLLPEGVTVQRQKANFIFDIYRAENLTSNENSAEKKTRIGPNTYVEINFAGSKVKTTLKKKEWKPVWNERLIIPEPFPPLCQRIKVRLHTSDIKSKTNVPTRYVNIKAISSDREQGFLPTYGPSYLHFYDNNYADGYVGCVLLEINTELLEVTSSNNKATEVGHSIKRSEVISFPSENMYLFATVFDVNMIHKKYRSKPLSFKLTLGNVNTQSVPSYSKPEQLANTTPAMVPKRTNKSYWHLALDDVKPCMYLLSDWPDTKKRMFNSNILEKIRDSFKEKLDPIQEIFISEDFRDHGQEIEDQLLSTIDFLNTTVRKYLDLLENFNGSGTNLDKERQKLNREEMENIVESLKDLYNPRTKKKCFRKLQSHYKKMQSLIEDENIVESLKDLYNPRTKKKCFRKLQSHYKKMQSLIEDAQDCLPNIYIWMFSGKNRVAYSCVSSKEIIYSSVEEVKGELCGKLHYIFFQQTNQQGSISTPVPSNFECQMRVMLWLGPERNMSACMEYVPAGSTLTTGSSGVPNSTLQISQTHKFQFRAHIFQGRFTPGSDKSGLCDPFVEVTIDRHSRTTQVIKSTLNPVWDQTLIFSSIEIYGSKPYIKDNPPQIFLEVFDKDELQKKELVGRATIIPEIKFIDDAYIPSALNWIPVYKKSEITAEILSGFELLEISGDPEEINDEDVRNNLTRIPIDIKPELVNFRIEVFFWGMRDLKRVQLSAIHKPRITVLCSGMQLHSDTIKNAKSNPNFTNCVKYLEVVMPVQEVYIPPIILKLYDSRNFGIYAYAGTHMINVKNLIFHPLIESERLKKLTVDDQKSNNSLDSNAESIIINIGEATDTSKEERYCCLVKCIKKLKERSLARKKKIKKNVSESKFKSDLEDASEDEEQVDIEDFDWWTKFYASLEPPPANKKKVHLSHRYKLKVYTNELEKQPEFNGFTDMLQTFQIYKGKKTGDELLDAENITGVFKGSMKIYRWPLQEGVAYVTKSGLPLENGVFQDFPSNAPLRCLLRVYCVRAIGLRPKDLNGKSDPYLILTLGDKVIDDQDNRVMRQLNPVFGRCFEFNATYPYDHMLTIAIWDWDMTTKDDLVGETKIDVENRFYTYCRANCGLAESYQESGYCEWRDQYKPSVILENLCRKWKLDQPKYNETSVTVGSNVFTLIKKEQLGQCQDPKCILTTESGTIPILVIKDENQRKEMLSLTALRRWNELPVVGCHFVPEHVETRSLYDPRKPGIEQGKIQLWVDIFPYSDLPPPKQVNITPRKPVPYELRVIIWNVEEITLNEDDFFAGEKKSDIYVKGWLASPDDAQYTDVHYRSLTGEGNFNWRFIFRFDYLSTENKLVIKRKESIFHLDETEYKLPCKITLQVWDNDTFSADDFLGTMTMELSRLPRGAPNTKKCEFLGNPKTLNLFKIKRTRGWWPFTTKTSEAGNVSVCGKLDAEFELVSAEEANANPAGFGRDEPRGLPKPNRPDTSFSWFRNPLKALKYLICKLHCKKCVLCFLFITMIISLLIAVISLPKLTLTKLLSL